MIHSHPHPEVSRAIEKVKLAIKALKDFCNHPNTDSKYVNWVEEEELPYLTEKFKSALDTAYTFSYKLGYPDRFRPLHPSKEEWDELEHFAALRQHLHDLWHELIAAVIKANSTNIDVSLNTLPTLSAVVRMDREQGKETVPIQIQHTVALADRKQIVEALSSPNDRFYQASPLVNQVLHVRDLSRKRYTTPRDTLNTPKVAPPEQPSANEVFFDESPPPPRKRPDARPPKRPFS